jgi:hypothetical protein
LNQVPLERQSVAVARVTCAVEVKGKSPEEGRTDRLVIVMTILTAGILSHNISFVSFLLPENVRNKAVFIYYSLNCKIDEQTGKRNTLV